MKVITESDLRSKCLKAGDTIFLNCGDYLTSQAEEFIKNNKLIVLRESDEHRPMPMGKKPIEGYVSEDKTRTYKEKPEHMTHLKDNILVYKNSARIRYRGMLDYAQAKTIETQVLAEEQGLHKVCADLQSVLIMLRKLMSCDVLDTPLDDFSLLGLGEKEIREISHNPKKHIGIGHSMPDKSDGALCASVNVLRTIIRQTELSAMDAYFSEDKIIHEDAICALNRLSSAVYIIYCRLTAGFYKD